jgi:hypothetical protein
LEAPGGSSSSGSSSNEAAATESTQQAYWSAAVISVYASFWVVKRKQREQQRYWSAAVVSVVAEQGTRRDKKAHAAAATRPACIDSIPSLLLRLHMTSPAHPSASLGQTGD